MTCEERRGVQMIRATIQARYFAEMRRQDRNRELIFGPKPVATGWPVEAVHDLETNTTQWVARLFHPSTAQGIARLGGQPGIKSE